MRYTCVLVLFLIYYLSGAIVFAEREREILEVILHEFSLALILQSVTDTMLGMKETNVFGTNDE